MDTFLQPLRAQLHAATYPDISVRKGAPTKAYCTIDVIFWGNPF